MNTDKKLMMLEAFCEEIDSCAGCPINKLHFPEDCCEWDTKTKIERDFNYLTDNGFIVIRYPVEELHGSDKDPALWKEKTIKGLDGTVYKQDEDKQGWTGHDLVNHPSHYCREGGMESIDEMVAVFGKEAVMNFCLCNVWKYRYRASDKNGMEDLKKSDWYMKKYCELKRTGLK